MYTMTVEVNRWVVAETELRHSVDEARGWGFLKFRTLSNSR